MGFAIAAGVAAVAGAATSYIGSTNAANAAQDAANAQRGAANNYQNWLAGNQAKSLAALGPGPTPAQMSAYQDALSAQEASVQRQEALAKSINPALVSAGAQLNDLIQGKSAPVLANLQNQRQLQRQDMLTQLRQQMGPGAESSTAGIQALSKFDSETANLLSGAQQGYIQTLSQLPLAGASLESTLGQGDAFLNNLQANDPNAVYGRNKANLISGFASSEAPAQEAMINAAGSSGVGAALQGRAMSNLGNSLIQGSGAIAGYGSLNKTTTMDPNAGRTQNSIGQAPLGNSLIGTSMNNSGGYPYAGSYVPSSTSFDYATV